MNEELDPDVNGDPRIGEDSVEPGPPIDLNVNGGDPEDDEEDEDA